MRNNPTFHLSLPNYFYSSYSLGVFFCFFFFEKKNLPSLPTASVFGDHFYRVYSDQFWLMKDFGQSVFDIKLQNARGCDHIINLDLDFCVALIITRTNSIIQITHHISHTDSTFNVASKFHQDPIPSYNYKRLPGHLPRPMDIFLPYHIKLLFNFTNQSYPPITDKPK